MVAEKPGWGGGRAGDVAARLMAGVAATVSITTLVGYAAHIPLLVNSASALQPMSVITALLCAALAIAIYTDLRQIDGCTRLIGLVVLVGSASVLFSQGLTGRDALSPFLVARLLRDSSPAGTSVATAASAALLAVGCLARPRGQPAAAASIAVMVTAGIALLGYAYGVRDLYALSPFRTMSLKTAGILFVLALAMLLANRQAGISGLIAAYGDTGRATRRRLGFLILPPVAGYVLLRATSAKELGPAAGMAFLVILTVVPLAALILRDARAATEVDHARRAQAQADQAMFAAQARYQALFNQIESGFCVIEVAFDTAGRPADYRFVEVNPAFAFQSGLTDALGRWMRDLAPDHEQYWFDIYGMVALTGEPARFEENAIALGRFFDVYAFRIDAPQDRHVAVLFNDISKRRRAELDLKGLNETLEQRVAERAAELDRVQDALRQSQKLEAIGQLTGGVAHDFNNLLTVIRGSVELLKRPSLSPERQQRYLDAIGETADRAAKLTGQLLAFARRQVLRPEVFDAGGALTDVLDIVSTLTGPGIELLTQTPSESCFILTDRSQFETAIINMAINARDAMSGEGRITIAIGPVAAIPGDQRHPGAAGDFVATTIADTGVGIPDQHLSQIFEPFFTTKEVGAGTGLGLSQVIGFAKQSGGDVRVESTPGKGAAFTLYLPRAELQAAPSHRETPPDSISGAGACVLVVEDNAQVGDFAVQALAELGYQSVLATNARLALERLAQTDSHFDVVFSDVVMPGMTGVELRQEISRRHPNLPVILASGYSHVLTGNALPGFELLQKPYSVEQLSRALQKALAGTRCHRS